MENLFKDKGFSSYQPNAIDDKLINLILSILSNSENYSLILLLEILHTFPMMISCDRQPSRQTFFRQSHDSTNIRTGKITIS